MNPLTGPAPRTGGLTRAQFLKLATAGAAHLLLTGCNDSSGSSGHDESGTPLYVTYDDGPSSYTLDLLDALQGAPVTFFMLGAHVEAHPDIASLVKAEGHAIGNHSYSHADFDQLSETEIAAEIDRGGEAIRNALGFSPTLFRPPYLSGGEVARRLAEERGYRVIYGINTHDYDGESAEWIVGRVLKAAAPGAILFLHDSDPTGTASRQLTVEATRIFVPQLRDLGYGLRRL